MISTRSNPLHYLCEWNKQCLPHCWNYVTFCRWHDIMLYIALSTVHLTIRYFRQILMTYAHGPATTCLNLVCKNASTRSFLTRNNYNPPKWLACQWPVAGKSAWVQISRCVADLRPNMVDISTQSVIKQNRKSVFFIGNTTNMPLLPVCYKSIWHA